MFNFFEKKDTELLELIKEFEDGKKIIVLIEKAKNLIKLGRKAEADLVYFDAEQIALNLKKNNDSHKPQLMLALLYKEKNELDRAEDCLKKILSHSQYRINKEETLTLQSELQKIQRENIFAGKNSKSTTELTTIYSCQNCGRLINYVTVPCIHCKWHPTNLIEFAKSISMSTGTLKVQDLVFIARKVSNGSSPSEVVGNIDQAANKILNLPEDKTNLKYTFGLLQQNFKSNIRDINSIRKCRNCGNKVLLGYEGKCKSCNQPTGWPDAIKLLICMDNILMLFENKVRISNSDTFSNFVLLIVSMIDTLLRKQETPSQSQRNYALRTLKEMGSIINTSENACIELSDINNLKVHLVGEEGKYPVDGTEFAGFMYVELNFFIEKMINGIKI